METENESDWRYPIREEAAAGIREAHIREVRLLLRTKGSCSLQRASLGLHPCAEPCSLVLGVSPLSTNPQNQAEHQEMDVPANEHLAYS